MSRLKRTSRIRDTGDDRGFSLTELLISMSIFSLLMALVFGLLITMTQQASDNFGRVEAVEQARLGLMQIDRQIRSGNLILDPANETAANSGVPANYSLRVYTQERGEEKCAQWRVDFPEGERFGSLEFRQWPDGNPSAVTSWQQVAGNIVKPAGEFDANDSATWPPFWLDTTNQNTSEAQNIRITLRASDPRAREDALPATLTTVVTGRNTVFGYSPLLCSAVPSP